MQTIKRRGAVVVVLLALALIAAGCSTASSSTASGSNASRTGAPAPTTIQGLAKYTNCNSSGQAINPNLTVAFAQTDLNTPWRVAEMNNFKTWANKLCVRLIWNQAN